MRPDQSIVSKPTRRTPRHDLPRPCVRRMRSSLYNQLVRARPLSQWRRSWIAYRKHHLSFRAAKRPAQLVPKIVRVGRRPLKRHPRLSYGSSSSRRGGSSSRRFCTGRGNVACAFIVRCGWQRGEWRRRCGGDGVVPRLLREEILRLSPAPLLVALREGMVAVLICPLARW